MTPVSFADCFGWLHTAPLRSDTAIVICRGLSDDALTAHRPLRLLADQLATAGYPALRFDYRGTGDSTDLTPGEVEMTAWLASLRAACDAARIMTGVPRLILCGFRFGASLAALVAAERTDITGLILINPILRGRSWLRQMTIEARLKRLRHGQEEAASPEDILPVSTETAAAINALDLRTAAFSTGIGILILPHIAGPAFAECISAWTARGAVVTQAPFAGLEPLLRPTFMNHECDADVSCILGWLPRLPADESASPTSGSAANVFAESGPSLPAQFLHDLAGPGWSERPVFVAYDGQVLRGILCTPTAVTEQIVLMTNVAGDPHFGPERGSVVIARALTAAGIASLRLDFAGIGDSPGPDGDVGTHIFGRDRMPEIAACLDALARMGYRRFALYGLCAGAYHAFRAAVREPRIGTLLLVNLPFFAYDPAIPVEQAVSHAPRQPVRHRPAQQLQRLCLVLALGLRAVAMRIHGRIHGLFRPAVAHGAGAFSTHASLAALSARGTRTLMLLAPGNMGEASLASAFPGGVDVPEVTVQHMATIDHELSRPAMQRTVADAIVAFLRQPYDTNAHVDGPDALKGPSGNNRTDFEPKTVQNVGGQAARR